MEKNVWYSRISFSTLFRALRLDPEYAVRLISRYWFAKHNNFTVRVKQEFQQNREGFATWFKTWFEDEFCLGLLQGQIEIEDATKSGYIIACQLLKKKAAVANISIRDFSARVYFARHDVRGEIEKIAAAAKSIEDVCQLFAAYYLYPPPRRNMVAMMKRLCLRCGHSYLALMRPPSIDLIIELFLAYPHYFYIDERLVGGAPRPKQT
jgi:hypothetical protein